LLEVWGEPCFGDSETFIMSVIGTTIGSGGRVGARVFEAGGAGFCDVSQGEASQAGHTKNTRNLRRRGLRG